MRRVKALPNQLILKIRIAKVYINAMKKILKKIACMPKRVAKQFSPVDPVRARALIFEEKHGYSPNFYEPKTFSEKLNARILFEDDPYYLLYGTKLFAPYYAEQKVTEQLSFAKRLKVKEYLDASDFEDLPEQFIMKSSFGSGMNKVVRDKSSVDPLALCGFFNNSIKTIRNAKGATLASNCVIFEELLLDEKGRVPADFKFHCFWPDSQRFRYILEIMSGRFADLRQIILDDEGNVLDFSFVYSFGSLPKPDGSPELPANFSDMIDVAKKLSSGFNYIRVDLFNIGGDVYFGEMTPFHGSGWGRISHKEWDFKLGELWQWEQ